MGEENALHATHLQSVILSLWLSEVSVTQSEKREGYALFDLDQTLIPWDTQLLFCDFVLKRYPWRRFYLLILVPFLPLARLLGAETMKRIFLNYLLGMSSEEIDSLANEFVEQHIPASCYDEILQLLIEQQSLGRLTILSSASPEFWVKPIAQKLGFDHGIGTHVEVRGKVGLFPDIIGGNNKGANKISRMRHLLPEHFDPNKDTLTNSCGFSDSHADLPMLSICEQAVTINPTEKLRHQAQQFGWEILEPSRPTRGKLSFAIACLRQSLGIM